MTPSPVEVSACHACGLIQRLPDVEHTGALLCVRCGATLRHVRRQSVLLCGLFGVLGLLLFVVAFAEPIASVVLQGGRFATTDVLSGPQHLREAGAWLLSVAVVLTLLLVPLMKLTTVTLMALAVRKRQVPDWLRRAFAAVPALSQWAMVEVFLLGAFIALFRLQGWVLVDYGPALFALSGAAVCSVGIDVALDRAAFWRAVPLRAPVGAVGGWHGCHGCDLLVRAAGEARCPRCRSNVHPRKPDSVSRTWAFVLAAALLLIPANVLPVMTVIELGQGGPSTILGGTLELAELELWGLATLVFVASVVVPFGKLAVLSLMLVLIRRGAAARLELRTRLVRIVALSGRWSMLDIFATMMLAALARFGWLGSVRPEAGATAFCAVVVLTMLASEAFDPRLMWDAAGRNGPPQLDPGELGPREAVAPA